MWLDDLQLYLLSDSRDSVSLFEHTSGAAPAPLATANSGTRSQWLIRDAATCLAIRNHLPLAECAHFGQHRTAQALYDAVVACYSLPATAALGRLLLPYRFLELSAFATVEDLVSHLRTSDAHYRAALPTEFLAKNPPLMYITLYFIVTCLPHSLRSVRDHFLALNPTALTVDLLEQKLLAAEPSVVAVGAAHGTPRTPFFEGCSPSPLAPSYASASASVKHRSSKGKGGRGGGGGSGSGGGGSSGGGGGSGGGGSGGGGGGSGGSGGVGGGSSGSGGSGSGGSGGGRTGAQRGGSGGCQRQGQQRQSKTPSPQQLREWLFQRGASGAPPCSCHLLSHQTLLWHHRLGHPSLPCLRSMHSRLLVSGLPRSLPPLPPSPAPPCLPCVEGRQCAAPHSSFPPTTTPLQTLHMDVWGPARVSGQGRERYFLLVVDEYTRYTTVFPLRSKGEVPDVLITWIRAVRLQLRERFRHDLPVLHLHSDRGGEFSSDLLRDFCRGEGITKSFTLPPFSQQNGIAEPRIGLVMEVARTSMIHAAAPHFLWPFAVRYAAHQLNLWPCVSLPETSPTLCWIGEVGDASVFRCSAPPPVPLRAEPEGVDTWGAESEGAESGGAEPQGAASSGGPAGASPRLSPWPEPLSPQQQREWLVRCARLWRGAAGAGATGDTRAGGARVTAVAGGTGDPPEPRVAGGGGTGAQGTGAGGAGAGAGGTNTGGAGAGGAGAVDPRAGGARAGGAAGTSAGVIVQPRSYFVPLLQQVLGVSSSTGLTPPLLCPPPDQTQPPLQPASPLPAPSPYTEQSCGLTERGEPASRPASPVRIGRRAPRPRPHSVPGTHTMALRPSSVPLRVPLPAPLESALLAVPNPESDFVRAASPTVSRLLATVVTDPSFEYAAVSALIAEPLDFAACRLDYATTLVAESEFANLPLVGGECALGTDVLEDRQEDFECLAAAVPRFASMLLALEGDLDAPDIPTPRSYVEAITSSSPAFKARYIARGFSQQQGVDYFQTFSPTPKMTTLRVLLHIAAQRDYELHSLDFSTAFLQGSLHEEIRLRRPPGFTGSFPPGTHWSLWRPVYGLRQASREWHDTLRTTLAALGFAPSTADPSLFLRTDTSLPPFYVLVYVDDLVLPLLTLRH
ncbi:unnamed protein product [Closterium sp. NIES-54]